MNEFNIGKKKIGPNHKPFIIAELSANHGNSLKNCLELVKIAKKSGADAIKLQTYLPETITLNSKKKDFSIKSNSPWFKYKTLWNLYSKSFTPWEWHKKIFSEAKKYNLEFFSSPFDEKAVDYLNNLGVSAFKIASSEINFIPMIRKIIEINKPMIISLGFANKDDVKNLIKLFKKKKFKKFAFLNCVSKYPAKFDDYSFNDHNYFAKKYIVGLSDHTVDARAAIYSLLNKGCIFEKHIKLSKKNTIDDFFSADLNNFYSYCKEINLFHKVKTNKKSNLNSNPGTKNKRSIYVSKIIKKGERFNQSNLKIVRPGNSLHPKFFEKIIGKKSKKKFYVGDRINLNDFK